METGVINTELFKLILEHLDGVVITDPQGRYVYVNQKWSEMMGGVSIEEVRGKYVKEYIPNTKIDYVLKTGEPYFGNVIVAKGPDKVEAFSSYLPIFKDGRIVAGFINVIFRGMEGALDFSKKINSMLVKIKYYEEELRQLRGAKYTIDNIIGISPEVRDLKEKIFNAARSNSTVIIEGETGTGKELVAHSIHDLSLRASKSFIKVNCAAIPKNLLESEFFGYEEGAFTGAIKGGRPGKFEMANGGSLFLDEINQLPLELQPKLLRTLQEREVERIGGSANIPVDVRIIVASNIELQRLVREKKFRADLFYRLNVIKILLPPLRERKEDIDLLVDSILEKLNFELGMAVPGVEEEAKLRLMDYNWPGNIRELQNVVERAMNLSWGERLKWSHFEEYFDNKTLSTRARTCVDRQENRGLLELRDEFEKSIITDALAENQNNKAETARALNISRALLYRKIEKFGIDL